jgi:membrane protein YqaA with SNARE-associated domain
MGELIAVYGGLFVTAFLAATILPAQSEALLVGLIVSGRYSEAALIAVATVGNTLGAGVNWFLGYGIERFRDSRWFPVSQPQLERVQAWYHRWGRWTLLFSWLPIGGDALTVAAGVLREPLVPFLLIVGAGKLVRYLVVAAAVWGFGG